MRSLTSAIALLMITAHPRGTKKRTRDGLSCYEIRRDAFYRRITGTRGKSFGPPRQNPWRLDSMQPIPQRLHLGNAIEKEASAWYKVTRLGRVSSACVSHGRAHRENAPGDPNGWRQCRLVRDNQ